MQTKIPFNLRLLGSCALVVWLLTSCITTGDSTGKWVFPSDIAPAATVQMDAARNYLSSVDGLVYERKKFSVYLTKTDGTKKISGMWCWISPYSGHYVGGLCFLPQNGKIRVQVGANPVTKGEVRLDVLKHELAHAWRMGCYNDGTHNGRYSKGLLNWNPASDMTVRTLSDGTMVIENVVQRRKPGNPVFQRLLRGTRVK